MTLRYSLVSSTMISCILLVGSFFCTKSFSHDTGEIPSSQADENAQEPPSGKLPIRNELGKRVRRFEERWQSSSPEIRAQSTLPMERAVQSFFGLQLVDAARSLDEAYLSLQKESAATLEPLLGISVIPAQAIYDAAPNQIQFDVQRLYDAKISNSAPNSNTIPKLTIRLHASSAWGKTLTTMEQTFVDVSIPSLLTFQMDQFPLSAHTWIEGADWRTEVMAEHQGEQVPIIGAGFSTIDSFDNRFLRWSEWIDAHLQDATHEVATSRLYSNWLRAARKNLRSESDLPYAHFVACLDHFCSQRPVKELPRVEWLQLQLGKQQSVIRVRIPSNSPQAWVVAMHGAGGSENMFFETYGAGRLVDLASDRSWGVVAPRLGLGGASIPLDSILREISSLFGDPDNPVFLVGHSMGAAQVVAQASRIPERIDAAVVVGGGGTPRITDELRKIPFWLAAGDRDFGKRGAQSTYEKLKNSGVAAQWREYPDTEHMVIMQASLDDLYQFLDSIAKRPRP